MMRFAAPPILASALLALAVPSGLHAQVPPAPAAARAATVKNLIFLIRGPDGVVSAIRTVSSQQQGAVLLLINAKGGRAMVQTRTVIGQMPWLTDEEVQIANATDLGVLAAQYELTARRIPSLKETLGDEAARLRTVQKGRADAITAQKNAAETRIKDAISTVYDPAAGYTPEAIESLLAAAEAVRAADPAAAARIDEWAKPFRAHLEKLKAGDVYENGAWITREEIARRVRAERYAVFQKSLDGLKISGGALPAETVHGFVTKSVTTAGVAMLVGLALMIFARRLSTVRAAGVALFVGGPAWLAALFYLATRNPADLPADSTLADIQPVIAALEAAHDAEPAAGTHALSESALNTFLARFIRIERAANPTGWAATREALVVRLLPDRLCLFELVRSVDREWIVRYTLDFRPAGAKPPLAVSSVKIGALDLPANIAQPLWKGLEPQLAAILSGLHVTERFAVQKPADGVIKLTPLDQKLDPDAPLVIPPPSFNENSPVRSATPARSDESTASPAPKTP